MIGTDLFIITNIWYERYKKRVMEGKWSKSIKYWLVIKTLNWRFIGSNDGELRRYIGSPSKQQRLFLPIIVTVAANLNSFLRFFCLPVIHYLMIITNLTSHKYYWMKYYCDNNNTLISISYIFLVYSLLCMESNLILPPSCTVTLIPIFHLSLKNFISLFLSK